MQVGWARREKDCIIPAKAGVGGGRGWTPGPEESSPQPLGVERRRCLTMMSRLPSESTGTGDDKYGGFKASAPSVPHLGLPRGPAGPQDAQLLKQTGPSSNPNFWFVWPKSVAATSHRGRNPTREELNSRRVFVCPFRSWGGGEERHRRESGPGSGGARPPFPARPAPASPSPGSRHKGQ